MSGKCATEAIYSVCMRICFYCDTLFTFGGVQRVLAGLAKELSRRHEVTVLTRDDPGMEDRSMYDLQDSDVKFRYLSLPELPLWERIPCKAYSLLYKKVLPQNELTTKWYSYSSFPGTFRKMLVDALNGGEYDVVIGVHVFPSLFLAGVRKQLRGRVIGWMHNSYDAFFSQPGIWLWKGNNRFRFQARALDKIVVLTKDDQRLYRERMALDTTVIYNPLTMETRGAGNPSYKKFLAVGRMSRLMKGFDILVEGFALFARGNDDWTLDIVGEGPEEPLIRSLIAKHHLEERVKIFPFTKDIQKHYAAASVYVLSSRWEGFGLVLIEAMSHGLPVISSDVPVGKELLGGRDFSFIFQNGDAASLASQMRRAADCPDLAKLGRQAKEYAAEFDTASIAGVWEKMLLQN